MMIEILINRPYLVYLPPAVVSQGRIIAATSSVAQIPDQGLMMMILTMTMMVMTMTMMMILTMTMMMILTMTMVVTMTMTMMKYLMILSSGGKML